MSVRVSVNTRARACVCACVRVFFSGPTVVAEVNFRPHFRPQHATMNQIAKMANRPLFMAWLATRATFETMVGPGSTVPILRTSVDPQNKS